MQVYSETMISVNVSIARNFMAITLTITGKLNPVIGALVHNTGSVLVITNSALLLKWKLKQKIITTRPTGGLHQGYKPLLLGQRLKALAFSLDCGNSVYTAFPQLRSSHIALDSSLPLKGYCYYLALTLKRVFIFLYTQLIHCYIMLFLLLDIFFYCSLI